jgi:hypothetical protein
MNKIGEIKRLIEKIDHNLYDIPIKFFLQIVKSEDIKIYGPGRAIPSYEIRELYELRSLNIKEKGIFVPGYEDVKNMIAGNEENWLSIGVEDQKMGGIVVYSENEKLIGCYAYIIK